MTEASKRDWPGPKGLIPVTSGKAEDANVYNRAYLDNIHVEMRVIDSVEPELGTELFGEHFSSPIMMPAFSHLNKVGEDGKRPMVQYALAAKELQLMNWVGMEEDADYAEIAATGARTVRIIKPFRDHAVILEQIDFAVRYKAIAVGIDIDHVPGKDGKYDIVDGIPMGPVTREDLRAFVAASPVPFVAKGVLSVQDALPLWFRTTTAEFPSALRRCKSCRASGKRLRGAGSKSSWIVPWTVVTTRTRHWPSARMPSPWGAAYFRRFSKKERRASRKRY